jgi:NTP pyrophosphatase (non-canonical NTP hydrolase)
MMQISEWQSTVDQWIKEYGVRYFDVKTNGLLLAEETGELCRLIARRYGEQSFKTELTADEIRQRIEEEIGDIYFVLTCISNQLEVDLEKVLAHNIEKKTNRDQQRHHTNKKLH